MVLRCGRDNLLKPTAWRSFQVQRTLRAPSFHLGGVWCRACIGADERHVAAGSADGTVLVWSVSEAYQSILTQSRCISLADTREAFVCDVWCYACVGINERHAAAGSADGTLVEK